MARARNDRRAPIALLLLVALTGAALPLAGCATTVASNSAGGKLQVVAAENFWGSIASQLGGAKVDVKSIVVNPNTDPHAYQPTAADAIALAGSQVAIVNGIGYDPWSSQLLNANPSHMRIALNVGALLGLRAGDNPHQWYSPTSVQRVVTALTSDYQRLDPKDAAYFEQQHRSFETTGLAQYNRLIARIKARYTNVPVGYSESIFQPLGEALGLELATPYSFAKAISEGSDISAADKQTVDAQAQDHRIKVWVYNSQNVTPDVQRVNELAGAAGIPVTTITETLVPRSASYQQWQVAQLIALERALHEATGR